MHRVHRAHSRQGANSRCSDFNDTYRFAGQCIGLAVAGADADHFVPLSLPTKNRYDLTVHSGPDCPSHILLPSPHPSSSPADQDTMQSPSSGDALNRA